MRTTLFAKLAPILIWASISGASLFGQSMPPRYIPDAVSVVRAERPTYLLSLNVSVADLVSLDRPTMSMAPGNQVGLIRTLPEPRNAAGKGGVFAFRSIGATRSRLHLKSVAIGEQKVLWVRGTGGEIVTFGSELIGPEGDLWTPSVDGDAITIEWTEGTSFVADAIGHIQPIATSTSCYLSAACASFPDKTALSSSIAHLLIAKASGFYLCTGGLINDKKSADRLFLTANHCISTQSEASSVEFSWDVAASACGANDAASRTTRTNGASLLVTSPASDVTLLRTNSLPGGRYSMGWTAQAPTVGTLLRRISHPGTEDGSNYFQQIYSSSTVYGGSSLCQSAPRPSFLYASATAGAAGPGSSGSPVIIDGGYIVGQLNSGCGPNPNDGCAASTLQIDGAFAASYGLLQPFLDPVDTSTCTGCVASANTACLLGGRFKATLTWHDFSANQAGAGSVIKYADNLPEVSTTYGPVSESVFFSMYPSAPKSIEAVVRMLKGVGINNMYWVFLSGFATAEYTVTITDTQTCKTWTRTSPNGASNITRDFNAFALP
jgi:hypothetical protein